MKKLIRDFLKDESGASLIEYVLIGGVISIGTIALMIAVNTNLGTVWANIRDRLVPPPAGP